MSKASYARDRVLPAGAYGERKKWTDAIAWYKKAAAADPENSMVWYNLGYAHLEKKQRPDRELLEGGPDVASRLKRSCPL